MKYGRAILRDVKPYVPGEQPRGDVIKLNTNENPYPPSPKVMEAIANFDPRNVRRYPDPVSLAFREACAKAYGLPNADWVVAGNGMDEILALAIRTFVDPGDLIVSTYPTYTLYQTLAELHGANFDFIDLTEDYDLADAIYSSDARLMFVPRPNAPTGVCHSRADMERLLKSAKGIVLIDEAYADFSEDTCIDLVNTYDNVIVSRTFSKGFSLAGMRLGIGMAQPSIINEFLKTKDSYNLNGVTQAAGLAAIQDYTYMERNAKQVCETRERLTSALRDLGFTVGDSQANFVLAKHDRAKEIFEALKEKQIFVRYFDKPRLQDAVRISIGTEAETDALIAALTELV